jgi:hypothetical protein
MFSQIEVMTANLYLIVLTVLVIIYWAMGDEDE